MLASFFAWWLARMKELLPTAWTNAAFRVRDAIIVTNDADGNITASARRNGQLTPIGLGIVARQGGRKPILVRPPHDAVLVKHHAVPTAPRRQLDQLLRHEIARITPFPAEALFWRWDGHAKPEDRSRTKITLTMVPRAAVAPALAALDAAGLKADSLEVGSAERPYLLPVGHAADRGAGTNMVRGLAGACVALAAVATLLPVGLQALTLHSTEAAITALQPAIARVEAARRRIAAGDAGRGILVQELKRTGDVLQTLAAVTRILPDNTYLTDFALRERQMTLSGRSESAPRLITALSADPAIRNTAFAAPVTRIEGATSDVFSIKAEVAE